MTSEGRNEMIRELREAVDFFQEVDAKLHPLTTEILESLGLNTCPRPGRLPRALASAIRSPA